MEWYLYRWIFSFPSMLASMCDYLWICLQFHTFITSVPKQAQVLTLNSLSPHSWFSSVLCDWSTLASLVTPPYPALSKQKGLATPVTMLPHVWHSALKVVPSWWGPVRGSDSWDSPEIPCSNKTRVSPFKVTFSSTRDLNSPRNITHQNANQRHEFHPLPPPEHCKNQLLFSHVTKSIPPHIPSIPVQCPKCNSSWSISSPQVHP